MTNINLIKQSISVFEESLAEYQQMKTDAMVLGSLNEFSAIDNAIVCTKTALEALQTELERQENKPLKLSELKEMIGEPVWVENYSEWGLLQSDDCVVDDRFGEFYVMLTNDVSFTRSKSVKFNELILYKHKTKGD